MMARLGWWLAVGTTVLSLAVTVWLVQRHISDARIPDVVNVSMLLEQGQSRFSDILQKPNAGEHEVQQAAEYGKDFGPRLMRAIEAVSAECRCTLINKAAVLAGEVHDWTPQVRAHLGDRP